MPFASMGQLQLANAEAGESFFAPDTMAFFRSRLESDLVAGVYFVTSEQMETDLRGGVLGPRTYTVRRAHEDGRVTTVGAFQQHPDLAGALAAIAELRRTSA